MPRYPSIVQLVPNVPQQLALQGGKAISPSGDQVRLELLDGRGLLLDRDAADRLASLDLRPGEWFWICLKWTGRRDDVPYVDLWLDVASEKRRAREDAPELERQLRESITWAQSGRKPVRSAPYPMPASAPDTEPLLSFDQYLVSQTNSLVDAFAESLKYAGDRHGNQIKPEDIRAFVVTSYIQAHPKGWDRRSLRKGVA